MIRYLVLFIVLAFVFLGLVALLRMVLQGPRPEREKRERERDKRR